MNILVPDSWLREYLVTKATPKQLKEYLSLCGPSIERVNIVGKETVYDVEITTNRPDSMSIMGVAREAAAILPRFGIAAKLLNDPYKEKLQATSYKLQAEKKLQIVTDPVLNPRWTSVVIEHVKIGPSPQWLAEKLELTGIRSLNNVVDITNYLMRAVGQPAHAFDYDKIAPKDGVPYMKLRAAKKGETLTTLDGKTHTLPGGDIVIEDGSGTLIDLCGIMGAENSSITAATTTIVLFMQTYDPVRIRRSSMNLAHRTEAAGLFEKGLDSELVMPTIVKGIELVKDLAGGRVASKLYDLYPKPYKAYTVRTTRKKLDAYVGVSLPDAELKRILTPLGFVPTVTKDTVSVTVPSWRQDITIDVDIIEEVARLYGYHEITSTLPDTEPPLTSPDPTLHWEAEVKTRLRDWGYTELYTYSMISENLVDAFGLDKTQVYKITNPLSAEWVYLRPHVGMSMLASVSQNLRVRADFTLFELSMGYQYRPNNLPLEKATLVVAWTGHKFLEAKGLAQTILTLLGVEYTEDIENLSQQNLTWYNARRLSLGEFGSLGEINQSLLSKLGIQIPITLLSLEFDTLVARAQPVKKYIPIPKYPSSFEDLAFVVPSEFRVGPFIAALKTVHPLISDVTLLDIHGDTRTVHITYQSLEKSLTADDIGPVRENLITLAKDHYQAHLKEVSTSV